MTRKTIVGLLAFAISQPVGFPVALLARPQRPSTEAPTHAVGRYFSVRDSIRMSRFDVPNGEPLFSPDKRFFSIVTSRGIIESDSIESTLWVFRTAEVRQFVESDITAQGPRGRPIVKLTRVPRNNWGIFYAPIISRVRWRRDSNALLFLGQDSGKQRLYSVDIRSGVVRKLSPKGHDVSEYETEGNTIAYLTVPEGQKVRIGSAINADAFDVTGEPLATFMPQIDDSALYRELWVIRNGKPRQVKKDGTRPVRLANHFPEVLSISPGGKAVVILLPSEIIPASWESYEPGIAYLRLRPEEANTTNRFNLERPTQYAVFELDTGNVRFILNGPNATTLGYNQENAAVWSSDSKKLLLTNTFLPLDDVGDAERSKRLRQCDCAIVDFDVNSTNCIAFSHYDRSSNSRLSSAQFGRSSDEVVLAFSNATKDAYQERYQRKGGVWQPLSSSNDKNNDLAESENPRKSETFPITIEIREAPDTPPALYATDLTSRRSRKLWDPNPELSSINLGRITPFEWKDKTGYQWRGRLVLPPDYIPSKHYPLVIQTYGFSEGFVTDGLFPTASAVRPLAAAGIMVLQMPRRTDHYGTAQEAPDQALGFESAIGRLTSDGLIDPERVGIIGFSRTCYHVLNTLVSNPALYAAATIADGMDGSYLQYLYSVGDPAIEMDEHIYGAKPFGTGLKEWLDRAPGFNLDKVRTPIRIETNSFGSILTQWETYASLYRQGKPVDVIYLPFADHLLQKPLERMASQQGNVDWFRFWLKGEEDSDPAKAVQYSRWRDLRKLQDKNAAQP